MKTILIRSLLQLAKNVYPIVPEFHASSLQRLDQEIGMRYAPKHSESQLKLFDKPKKGYGS